MDEATISKMLAELNWLLEYEEAPGLHTYHTCQYCHKNPARGNQCADCLRKAKTRLIKQSRSE